MRRVHPAQCLPPFVRALLPPATGRTIVVAAGKAAMPMTEAFLAHYAGEARGLVVTPHGYGLAPGRQLTGFELIEAGHPVPDAASVAAAARALAVLRGLLPDDHVVALLSGGGSALLAAPAPGLTLADKQVIARQLLAAGATIAEINCVRRKLSAVKGGRLALACAPATVTLLAISDVPGDVVADIASGPFSPDTTTLADARAVLARYRCRVPVAVERLLLDPTRETPHDDPRYARVSAQLCARSADALAAAASVLGQAGFATALLDDAVSAPARELAATHAALVRGYLASGRHVALVTGGETTVRVVNARGRGGRNTEYLLALAAELGDRHGVWALAADSDGIDGHGHHAGAVLAPDTLLRGATLGLDARDFLRENRSAEFFDALGELIVTGPTGTNANDVRLVLISPALRAWDNPAGRMTG